MDRCRNFGKITILGGKSLLIELSSSSLKFTGIQAYLVYCASFYCVSQLLGFFVCFFLLSKGKILLLHLIVVLALGWSGKELAIPPTYACNYIPPSLLQILTILRDNMKPTGSKRSLSPKVQKLYNYYRNQFLFKTTLTVSSKTHLCPTGKEEHQPNLYPSQPFVSGIPTIYCNLIHHLGVFS